MDKVETYIYDTDVRIKAVRLSKSLEDVFEAQNIEPTARPIFAKAALLAAAFASEEKDDEGSVFVSVKVPETKTSLTVLCETDGRLRGSTDAYTSDNFGETVLTVGRRLVVRGDYQSAVIGKTFEEATKEYFLSSRQTKAKTAFPKSEDSAFFFAEYFPGHDVNYRAGAKKADAEYIEKKLTEAMGAAANLFSGNPLELKKVSETAVKFGCTCTKRKIKHAIADTENLTFPIEVKCRFCGKTYIIEE